MNINNGNNIYNNNVSFESQKGEKSMTCDRNEKMNILMAKMKEVLLESSERRVPENGKFSKSSVGFYIPNTDNMGVLAVEYDAKDPKTQRLLTVGVYHKNSDRLTSNIIAKGSKKEILEYLKSKNNTQNLVEIVNDLSDKTDEYYASL